VSNRNKSRVVVIERELIRSRAFISLKTRGAAQALMIIMGKRQVERRGKKGREQWVCTNNGEILFPFSEAKEYGWGQKLFSKIFSAEQEYPAFAE